MAIITSLASVAVGPAASNSASFGFDDDPNQYWVDVLASVFDGFILLPFALLFVCCIQRLNLNRWLPVTAALATVLAVVVSSLIHEFVYPIFMYRNHVIEYLGFHRFEYLLMPWLVVCFVGALALAWLCRRGEPTEAFE